MPRERHLQFYSTQGDEYGRMDRITHIGGYEPQPWCLEFEYAVKHRGDYFFYIERHSVQHDSNTEEGRSEQIKIKYNCELFLNILNNGFTEIKPFPIGEIELFEFEFKKIGQLESFVAALEAVEKEAKHKTQ